jgi:transcriptional regulator with XRE-family HTH domain
MTHPITRYRKAHNLTMAALAAKAGISKSYLSMIEKGSSFSVSTAEALVKACDHNVSIEALMRARRRTAA